MAKKFLVPIDLTKNELQNAVVQVLASDPSSPVEGQIYYNSTTDRLRQYNGSTWNEYSTGAGLGNVSQSGDSGGAGRVKVSAGADKTIEDYDGGVGIIKSDADGVISPATAGTDYVTAGSTNTLTNKTIDANGTGNSITNLETADFAANVIDTDGTLAANSDARLATQKAVKTYADALSQGIKWKQAVRVATTTAGTLASDFENGDTVDGVALATGDRILIKDQAAGEENGIYIVAASGAPTRATDADTAAEIKGTVVSVTEGTANADTAWMLTTDTITLNTTALVFTNFITANVPAASTTVSGKVELATQGEAEAKSSTTLAVTPASLATFTRKATATIGDGAETAIAVTDNFGTVDKIANVRDASTNVEVECDKTYASNTVTFTFAVAPASNAYKVVIIG